MTPETLALYRDAAEAAHVTIRIVHRPEPRAVPHVRFQDGRVSESWSDFHAARRIQRPELYGAAEEHAA